MENWKVWIISILATVGASFILKGLGKILHFILNFRHILRYNFVSKYRREVDDKRRRSEEARNKKLDQERALEKQKRDQRQQKKLDDFLPF